MIVKECQKAEWQNGPSFYASALLHWVMKELYGNRGVCPPFFSSPPKRMVSATRGKRMQEEGATMSRGGEGSLPVEVRQRMHSSR